MKLRSITLVAAGGLVALLVAVLVAALAFGGPSPLKPMDSISDPFRDVDYSTLAPVSHTPARDGRQLAHRRYAPASGQPIRGSVVLVHGSSANSQSLHPLAQSFARAGFTAYALDIRGHGGSGSRGDVAYVGQPEDDLEDFVRAVQPARPATLVGFSSGGGFAIRVAGGARQALFDSYLFMAPYMHRHAATFRPDAGGWVSIGVPRLLAISLLDRADITRFNHLPVAAFAVNDAPRADLQPRYSYALAMSFAPHEDYQRDLRAIRRPAALLVGRDDEVFIAEKFSQVLADAGRPDIPVTLVPDTGHMMLTLSPAARAAAVAAVLRLEAGARTTRFEASFFSEPLVKASPDPTNDLDRLVARERARLADGQGDPW